MSAELEQLVEEVVEVTGADKPPLFEPDAPVLTPSAMAQSGETGVYLIGLIGGKEVGKSALVNALVGRQITASTSFGEGTQIVTAYTHVSQSEYLKDLLEREVPGKYTIVTHEIPTLVRQVLLDLPDIDSHWQAHVEITRKMLRHMLFPLWLQSVEKYADLQPQELLRRVAAGNAAQNFIFCLNKADQVAAEGTRAIDELRQDYAARLGRVLSLAAPPRVLMVSALHPDCFDMPQLRELLGTQKSVEDVAKSREMAARQRDATVWGWVQRLDLPQRARLLERLDEHAHERVSIRLGEPIVQQCVPAMLEDPAHRLAVLDDCLKQRCARWPLVNIVQSVAGPLASLLRRRLPAQQQQTLEGPEALVNTYLRIAGAGLATAVQATFAHLHQSQPLINRLYQERKLWESRVAELETTRLARELADTIARQRKMISARVCGPSGVLAGLWRMILTIGALLWFPLLQPIAQALLEDSVGRSLRQALLIVVRSLSVAALLQSVTFLILWFVMLWLVLRWDTQRRIDRQIARWKDQDDPDETLSLTGRALAWIQSLLEPVRQARQRMDALLQRAQTLKEKQEPDHQAA